MISDSILSVTLTNGEQVRFTKSEFVSITRSGDSDTTGGEGKAVAAATVTGGPAETPARSAPPSRHPGVAVFASLCPPLGDFAATDIESGGGATLGYGFGLELSLPIDDHNCWIISGAMQFYGFEMPGIPGVSMNNGSWRMILPMTGPRISLSLSEDASIFCEAMIGWDFQSSPEMNLGVPGFSLTLPSSSAGAIAYAIGGGVVFRDLVRLRVRFIDGGSPEYSISTSIALQSYMYTVKQPTKVIEISLGVIL